jgi:nucleotide-binding universal stress UspA family protein
MYRHLLIPTDGSALSGHAIAHGVALAKATGARVTGLFVASAPTPLVFEGLLPVDYMQPDEHAALNAQAAARYLGVIEKAARQAGVLFEGVTLTGEYPAEAILETAKKRRCDVIVMASHGRRGLAGVLLGSETQKVLTHAKVPVLVCR